MNDAHPCAERETIMENLSIGQRVERAIDRLEQYMLQAQQTKERNAGDFAIADYQQGRIEAFKSALAIVRGIIPPVQDGK